MDLAVVTKMKKSVHPPAALLELHAPVHRAQQGAGQCKTAFHPTLGTLGTLLWERSGYFAGWLFVQPGTCKTFSQTRKTPLGFFYSKERGMSLGSDTCSCWLILLKSLFTPSPYVHCLLAEALWLSVISNPFSFPKAVYYLLNFDVYSLLHLGQCSPLLLQDCLGPHKLFRISLSPNLQLCVLWPTCLPALFHHQHLKFEHPTSSHTD